MTRFVVLSYFEPRDLPNLVQAVRSAWFPKTARVQIGSYGVNREISDEIHSVPRAGYAPMFSIKTEYFYEERRLSRADEARLSPQAKRFGGQAPALDQLSTLPTDTRVRWGAELGCRYRDLLRLARKQRIRVDTWQFDEVIAECAHPGGQPLREFTRGIFRGLVFGRVRLGDRSQQGLVWLAHTALGLTRRRITPELTSFWQLMNRAAMGMVGEEYPEFDGDPEAAAREQAAGQRGLASGGPVRQALARKYIAGMTPGYHVAPGLGGNVHGWPRPRVNVWRASYVQARTRTGVAGYAEFDWRSGNRSPTVMRDVLHTLSVAARL